MVLALIIVMVTVFFIVLIALLIINRYLRILESAIKDLKKLVGNLDAYVTDALGVKFRSLQMQINKLKDWFRDHKQPRKYWD